MSGAAGSLACGADSAGIVLSLLYATKTAPQIFRYVPPEHAGRVFERVTKTSLNAAAAFYVAGVALRAAAVPPPFAAIVSGALAGALALLARGALPRFRDARARAILEPGAGGAVDGSSTLASHRLLAGIRVLAAASATAAFAALVLSLAYPST